jgi:hypothetical protein
VDMARGAVYCTVLVLFYTGARFNVAFCVVRIEGQQVMTKIYSLWHWVSSSVFCCRSTVVLRYYQLPYIVRY